MDARDSTVQPLGVRERTKLGIGAELWLALLPTATVLTVVKVISTFSNQKLLFASLASSAFLIYLDPQHPTNSVRTLVFAQIGGALLGFLAFTILGAGYLSAGLTMVTLIVAMILAHAVHPPAVSTGLAFAYKSGPESNLILFGAALTLLALLIVLQRSLQWLIRRWSL